jgi:hypothetical protein
MNGPSLIIYTSIRQQLYPPSYVHCTYILAMSKQTARHHALPRIIQEDKKKKRNVCVCWLFPFFQKKVHENGQEQNNNQVPVSCWVSPSSPSTRLCPLHFLPKIKIKKGQDKQKFVFWKLKNDWQGKKGTTIFMWFNLTRSLMRNLVCFLNDFHDVSSATMLQCCWQFFETTSGLLFGQLR